MRTRSRWLRFLRANRNEVGATHVICRVHATTTLVHSGWRKSGGRGNTLPLFVNREGSIGARQLRTLYRRGMIEHLQMWTNRGY
jgi:hypothetical protein